MMSTRSELNQSPGGTPNLEPPGESYEPLKFRERATGQRDPRDEANLHRQLQRPSILYSLRSSSRDDQLCFLVQPHRSTLQEDMERRRNEHKKTNIDTWTCPSSTAGLTKRRRPSRRRRVSR